MKVYDLEKTENELISPSCRARSVQGEAVALTRLEVKKGEVTYKRSPDNEEMILVLSGQWLFHLPDGDVLLKGNQVLCIPAGTEYSSEVLENTIAIDISPRGQKEPSFIPNIIINSDPEQSLWAV